MIFSENTIEYAAMAVDRYKRPVVNETVLAGFLVRVAGKSNIAACISSYERTNLIETKRGPNNSKLIVEFGKLESAYRTYLEEVGRAIRGSELE